MAKTKADIKADIRADKKEVLSDRKEPVSLMEPLLIAEGSLVRGELTDLAVELAARSAGFRRSLPEGIVAALANLVRSMNCYYSNLIEGHDTHPIDIERALNNDYSADPDKRDLQLEAKAHIEVQRWIDGGRPPRSRHYACRHLRDASPFLASCCRKTCCGLRIPRPANGSRWCPASCAGATLKSAGTSRSAQALCRAFWQRFEQRLSEISGKTDAILATAAAHHRLAWIHPFLDGNGRVARLMSHATLLEALDTGAIWSVARGLARNVEDYKARPRRMRSSASQRSRWPRDLE